ncbi:hypothetical protein ACL2XG_17485 [Sodalis sp. RH24]|uniref:hypothetical protein n=1 Tax=unclassified Sodalis (in: enterobacteria) TaxID=2636512 RepID=UPI003965C1E8
MYISASHSMPDSTVVPKTTEQNSGPGKKILAYPVVGVKNAPEASATSPFTAVARFAQKIVNASGLTKLVSGLAGVGNAVGRLFGIGREVSSVASLFATGIKVAQYGVQKLLYEVMSLMKEQAWTIIGTWLRGIIDDGGHMTPYEVFASLITAIRDNEKMKLLFHEVATA